MYGSGKPDAAPAPPVPQLCASNAVSLPSAETPALDLRVRRRTVARVEMLFLAIEDQLDRRFGLPCASLAQMRPCASGPNLLPNPPPMYCVMTRTLACGILRPCAKPSFVPCTPCVDTHAVSLSPSHSQTQPCDLHAHVRDDMRRIGLLDDVRGRLEAGVEVAGLVDVALALVADRA